MNQRGKGIYNNEIRAFSFQRHSAEKRNGTYITHIDKEMEVNNAQIKKKGL